MDKIETERSSPEVQLENNDQLQSYDDPPVAKRPINVKIETLSPMHVLWNSSDYLDIFFFLLKEYNAEQVLGSGAARKKKTHSSRY